MVQPVAPSYRPLQPVTLLSPVGSHNNTVVNNTMVFVYLSISKHRQSTVKIWYKDKKRYTYIGHLPRMELAGPQVALGESVRGGECLGNYCILPKAL